LPRRDLRILGPYRLDLLRVKILDAEGNHAVDQSHGNNGA